MDSTTPKTTVGCHVVAIPFPGRGHVNPMMNLCNLLASKTHKIFITLVVTEEWLGLIDSDTKFSNIRYASIPNVIPSEIGRAANYTAFYEAAMTKMEVPVNQLLGQLEPPVTAIITDVELFWAIRIGNCRNIPVALLCTTSITAFWVQHYFDSIQDQNFLLDLLEHGGEHEDRIPEISTPNLADLRKCFHGCSRRVIQLILEGCLWVPKAQYLLFNSVYELEDQVYDTLKAEYSLPIYHIGPAIPFFEFEDNISTSISPNGADYLEWLDSHPAGSVLYVSLGSFLSVSSEQMDEIAAGLTSSGVRFLWVVRGETSWLKKICGDLGLIVPWCDQLKVLCHSSVGGFWTHCGWNSTIEAVFAGQPLLTLPIHFDQHSNEKQIVENWKIGWRVREKARDENAVSRKEIAKLVQKFMDQESVEVQNIRKGAKEIREICHRAVEKGGSSEKNLDAFINHVSQDHSS
ncbi:hypothetical protein ACOSP7_024104 [Xanthoceras sorbifolium]